MIDTVVTYLQEKGYEAHTRKVAGVEMIEAKKDSQTLHWDILVFDGLSKDEALQFADSLLDNAKSVQKEA
jgi:hypothetical protein